MRSRPSLSLPTPSATNLNRQQLGWPTVFYCLGCCVPVFHVHCAHFMNCSPSWHGFLLTMRSLAWVLSFMCVLERQTASVVETLLIQFMKQLLVFPAVITLGKPDFADGDVGLSCSRGFDILASSDLVFCFFCVCLLHLPTRITESFHFLLLKIPFIRL